MFKVNNRNTRTRCEIWSKLTIKTPERRYFTPCCSVFIVNFEQVNAGWEDVNGFKSTGRVTSFTYFDREKGLRNRGKVKIISRLVQQQTFYIQLDFKPKS